MSRSESPYDASSSIYLAKRKFDLNPDLKRFFVRRALEHVEAKRRFSVAAIMGEARRFEWVSIDGDPMRLNNNLCPGIARILIREHPEVRPFIETRRAACDGMPV